MSLPAWHEEPISKKHDRKSFDCGDPSMSDFLQRYARQSHESGAAKTFLAIDNADNKTILGFYSWLRARWLTPTRRRRFAAKASPGTMCLGSGSPRIATEPPLAGPSGLGGLKLPRSRRCRAALPARCG